MNKSKFAVLMAAGLLAIGGVGAVAVHAASPTPAEKADQPENATDTQDQSGDQSGHQDTGNEAQDQTGDNQD